MATKKQRARRAKTFRHDYALVTYDEEGNEVEVDRSEVKAKKEPAKSKSVQTRSKGAARTRALREPPEPSWRRSVRRGGLWGGVTIVASVLLLKGTPFPARIAIGAFYAAMFIPLTYWLDGMVYRRYHRKASGDSGRTGRRGR